jgi:putative hemolysin
MAEVTRVLKEHPHSAYPVAERQLEHTVGIVQAKDLLGQMTNGRVDIRRALKPALFLPEAASALKGLEALRNTNVNIAVVTDEYGGVAGIVTFQDFMTAIVGETAGPPPPTWPAPVTSGLKQKTFDLDGRLNLYEVDEDLRRSIELLDTSEFDTVAGFVLDRLRSLRVARVHVERVKPEPEEGQAGEEA